MPMLKAFASFTFRKTKQKQAFDNEHLLYEYDSVAVTRFVNFLPGWQWLLLLIDNLRLSV